MGYENTSKLLHCRKVNDNTENVHTYIKIYTTESRRENTETILTDTPENITFHPDIIFEIHYHQTSVNGSSSHSGGGLSLDADLTASVNYITGLKTYTVTANDKTLEDIEYLKSFKGESVYFKNHQEGDEIFTSQTDPSGSSTNITEEKIPGLDAFGNSRSIECKEL